MSYEKEYRHCLENTNKRELVDKIIYDEKEFIKKDKEIERLNKENEKLKEKITISVNEEDVQNIINSYEKDIEYINQLEKENKQLKDNWNKLKVYIKETKLEEFEKSYGKRYGKTFTQAEIIVCNMILNKMQELEGSGSDE